MYRQFLLAAVCGAALVALPGISANAAPLTGQMASVAPAMEAASAVEKTGSRVRGGGLNLGLGLGLGVGADVGGKRGTSVGVGADVGAGVNLGGRHGTNVGVGAATGVGVDLGNILGGGLLGSGRHGGGKGRY